MSRTEHDKMSADRGKKTEPGRGMPADRRSQAQPLAAPDGGFRPAHLFVIVTMIAAGGGVVAAGGASPAHTVFVSLAIGWAGLASYGLYRIVWPLVAPAGNGESETSHGRIQAALAVDRAAARRAISDLEFDRAMGKLSEADLQEMRARLGTGRSTYRDLIERDLSARSTSAEGRACAAGPAAVGGADAGDRRLARTCGGCGASNDPDVRFCKRCGNRLFV